MPKAEQKSNITAPKPSTQSMIPTYGIFIILLVSALYFAKDFLLPVTVAFILALTFSPLVRFLARLKIPTAISAAFLVFSAGFLTVTILYFLSTPIADLVERIPQIGNELKEKLSALRAPLRSIADAQKEMVESTSTAVEKTQTVVLEGPGFLQLAASNFLSGATTFAITLVLLTFILASGDMFYAKLVQAFDRMSDKKRALNVAHDIERVISRYLFTITLINVTLGIVIGLGLYVLDMPTPYIWGMVAALANFIPYVGALVGLAAVTVVAIVSFDTLGQAFVVSAFYFSCTTIEGQFLTPAIVGRRLELNAVAVFLAVGFWGWLWGVVGALIAVPMLMVLKTICDHTEGLKPVANFLSADDKLTNDSQ